MGVVTTAVAPEGEECTRPPTGYRQNAAVARGDGHAPSSPARDANDDRDRVDDAARCNGVSHGNGRTSRFSSLMSNADSVVSGASSVGSVTPTTSTSGSYSDVSGLFRGAPGLGGVDPSASPSRRRARRATAAISRQTSVKREGSKRNVFVPKPREMPSGRFAFFTEIFRIKGTIVLKVVPQIILAALMGLFANVVKLAYCGNGVASNEVGAGECFAPKDFVFSHNPVINSYVTRTPTTN